MRARELFVALALFPDRAQRDPEVVVRGGVIGVGHQERLVKVDRLLRGTGFNAQDREIEKRRAKAWVYLKREPVVALGGDGAAGDLSDLAEVVVREFVSGIAPKRLEVGHGRFVESTREVGLQSSAQRIRRSPG